MKPLCIAMLFLFLFVSTAFAEGGNVLLHSCQIAVRDIDAGYTAQMSHQDKFYEGACFGKRARGSAPFGVCVGETRQPKQRLPQLYPLIGDCHEEEDIGLRDERIVACNQQ
jgi:hypothetical protein